jgi:ABC transporter substrate binding protein
MRRRDFVRGIIGSATAWPLTLRAQQSKPKAMRRVAVLMPYSANDPQTQNRNAAFLQGLQQLGWTVGENVQIDAPCRSFVIVPDPVGAGFVDSMSRLGGNITGFTQFDYSIAAKWLALLKEIVPNTTRAAVLRDPAITAGIGQWATIQSVSSSVGIEISPISVVNAAEMERAVTAFARSDYCACGTVSAAGGLL